MKILRIKAKGLPLFDGEIDINFLAQQRVDELSKENLYHLYGDFYLNTACVFAGINASGKTSLLKVIDLAINILKNEPINHVTSKDILMGASNVLFDIAFLDKNNSVYLLEASIITKKTKGNGYIYSIEKENLYKKPVSDAKTKKELTDFSKYNPISKRSDELYLPDDVSMIIAYNKSNKESIELFNLVSYTNFNVLPYLNDVPLEVISFLDPNIESLFFEERDGKTRVHLKFKNQQEIILNRTIDLENYLSSGTIKGMIVFSMAIETLKNGGYLLIDEIENHFNKEIVFSLVRFFLDTRFNINGGSLIFTTHYPELLDEYRRNDSIFILRNEGGITVTNLVSILKRNDIKKSDAYQSGLLKGTAPSYERYLGLKKKISSEIEGCE